MTLFKLQCEPAGRLCNFEVLQFVKEEKGCIGEGGSPAPRSYADALRGVSNYFGSIDKCHTGVVQPSVMEHLTNLKLKVDEIYQIANLKPKNPVDLQLVIDDCEQRLSEEQIADLVDLFALDKDCKQQVIIASGNASAQPSAEESANDLAAVETLGENRLKNASSSSAFVKCAAEEIVQFLALLEQSSRTTAKRAPKLKKLISHKGFLKKLRHLLYYMQIVTGCDVSSLSLEYNSDRFHQMIKSVAQPAMIAKLFPMSTSIMLDRRFVGKENLKKLTKLRKIFTSTTEDVRTLGTAFKCILPSLGTIESQPDVDGKIKSTLKRSRLSSSSESSDHDAHEAKDNDSETSANWLAECLSIEKGAQAKSNAAFETLQEEMVLRQSFMHNRTEATRVKQMVRFLDMIVKANLAYDAEFSRKSRFREESEGKPFRISQHKFPTANVDPVVSFEGPEENRRFGGKVFMKNSCRCLSRSCYLCGPFKSTLHPDYQLSNGHDLKSAMEKVAVRFRPPTLKEGGMEKVVLAGLCCFNEVELSRLMRKTIYAEEDQEQMNFLKALDQWRDQDASSTRAESKSSRRPTDVLKKRQSELVKLDDENDEDYVAEPERRRRKHVKIHNKALTEKYAQKRRVQAMKRRHIAQKRTGQLLLSQRLKKEKSDMQKNVSDRFAEIVEPFDNFVPDDALLFWGRSSPEAEILNIEAPGFETDATPECCSEQTVSTENTDDDVYYERHLPMVKTEKVFNAERRRRMRAWRLKREALLRRRDMLQFYRTTGRLSVDANMKLYDDQVATSSFANFSAQPAAAGSADGGETE